MGHPLILVRRHIEIPELRGLSRAHAATLCGVGVGAGFGSGRSWTPASLGGTYLWADLDAVGAVAKVSQPALVDGDAEAVGAGAWSVYNCTASKSTSSPYEGTQHLDANVTGTGGSAYQDILTQGIRYLARGAAHGNGSTTAPIVQIADNSTAWTGTTSTSWQVFAAEANAVDPTPPNFHTLFVLRPDGGALGHVYYDALTLAALSVSGITCKGSLGNLAQATATAMPWLSDANAPTSVKLNGRHVLYFDGTADLIASSEAASTWPLHKAAGFTMTFVYKPDNGVAGTDTIIDTCNATNTNHGVTVEYDAANQQLTVKVANGTGTFELNKSTGASTLAKNAWHYVSLFWSQAAGLRVLIDAAAAVTQASGGAASSNDATATLQYGRTSGNANFLHGANRIELIRVGAITASQLAQLHAYTKAYYGL